jgi:hypothetical protein
MVIEEIVKKILKNKYTKNISIYKYICMLIILFTLYLLANNRARLNDEFNIWKSRSILQYVFTSYFPNNNKFILDKYEIKYPYGFSNIGDEVAISLIDNTYLNILPFFTYSLIIDNFEKELNDKFVFVDHLGSMHVWQEKDGNRLIYIVRKRRGGVNYLYALIK